MKSFFAYFSGVNSARLLFLDRMGEIVEKAHVLALFPCSIAHRTWLPQLQGNMLSSSSPFCPFQVNCSKPPWYIRQNVCMDHRSLAEYLTEVLSWEKWFLLVLAFLPLSLLAILKIKPRCACFCCKPSGTEYRGKRKVELVDFVSKSQLWNLQFPSWRKVFSSTQLPSRRYSICTSAGEARD